MISSSASCRSPLNNCAPGTPWPTSKPWTAHGDPAESWSSRIGSASETRPKGRGARAPPHRTCCQRSPRRSRTRPRPARPTRAPPQPGIPPPPGNRNPSSTPPPLPDPRTSRRRTCSRRNASTAKRRTAGGSLPAPSAPRPAAAAATPSSCAPRPAPRPPSLGPGEVRSVSHEPRAKLASPPVQAMYSDETWNPKQ